MRSFLEGVWGNPLYKEGSPNLTSLNAHSYKDPFSESSSAHSLQFGPQLFPAA
jgi:hypothetical protein